MEKAIRKTTKPGTPPTGSKRKMSNLVEMRNRQMFWVRLIYSALIIVMMGILHFLL